MTFSSTCVRVAIGSLIVAVITIQVVNSIKIWKKGGGKEEISYTFIDHGDSHVDVPHFESKEDDQCCHKKKVIIKKVPEIIIKKIPVPVIKKVPVVKVVKVVKKIPVHYHHVIEKKKEKKKKKKPKKSKFSFDKFIFD